MNRFGDIDWSFKRLLPIYGFHSEELVSIDKALQPIESQIKELSLYVKIAKKHCRYPNEHGLSKDQSASIYIYTMEWGVASLYRVLNKVLRSEDREASKLWFPYLKLFDTALNLLPTVKEPVWRGVPLDIGKNFTKNQVFTWWPASSCSSSVNIIQKFLQNENNSTLFLIEVVNGKKVSGYTHYENEEEVILRIGTEFRVKADPLKRPDGSHTVHLIEIDEDDNEYINKSDKKQPLATTMESLDVISKPSSTEISSEDKKSISHPPLTCHGRQCVVCGRCCDWYYAGHADDWEWIRKFREWHQDTVQRWRAGDYHDKFKLHEGAKCDRSIYYKASYVFRFVTAGIFDGSHLIGHLCVCDSPEPAK